MKSMPAYPKANPPWAGECAKYAGEAMNSSAW